ncbi:DNA-binding response regulator [Ammoniphilus oxalaticus]|uniref:DNA-binding response regulator n=1 Tax=Ammoniphilus oxalaticus TaxID=66863 RepID=A0A419SRP2_9BACL|nr:response regulator transcription factor [Ammoniphilus oxalaticus]RKD27104.1 DNA-binding response regulator [Ammoniphilus oxalaticus]
MIKILLVDDHPSVGAGTKAMIEQEEDMVVTVTNASINVLEMVGRTPFDIFLFDLNMPGINGLELTRRVMAIHSDTPVVIYTGHDIAPHFNLLVEAGIAGFISKTASQEQLITALRCVIRGESIIPTSLFRQLRRKEVQVATEEGNGSIAEISINEREQRILLEIAKGKGNREVAETLSLSQRTVEYNLTGIFEKLGVRSRAEAIAKARQFGVIPNEPLLDIQ